MIQNTDLTDLVFNLIFPLVIDNKKNLQGSQIQNHSQN